MSGRAVRGEAMKGLAPIRGRGASGNVANRFEQIDYVPDDEHGELDPNRPRTLFLRDASKSIIVYNDSPDVGFDASVNPYRGCEHGCIYCYARPTHEFLGFSAGLDFETRIMVKENAPELVREALASRKWVPQVVAISGVTDPYQPVERKLELTRRCLEVFLEHRNPVVIITKNRLVTRDVDVLAEMAKYSCAAVFVSVTTLDLGLNRVLEPRTSSPAQRLDAIAQLSAAGVPVGTLVAPVIPGLTDHEIAPILEAVTGAGARFAGYVALRLPYAVAPLFEQWLEEHYPDRREKVLNRVRSMRAGKLYDSSYGKRMRGEGPFAEQIARMFEVACRKAGILGRHAPLSTEHFRVPQRSGDQMGLFG